MTALYIGAGTDIFPPIKFRDIKGWIYIDSQPNSEFGNVYYEGFERPNFIGNLIKIMEQNEFQHIKTDNNIYTFYNKEHSQTICYETNTVFPCDLQEYHYECKTLVLCGFDYKDINIIDRFSHIITNNISCHELSDEKHFLSKNVSTMIIDKEWEYWDKANMTTQLIEKHITIEPRYNN